MIITSRTNPSVVRAASLRDKKYRDKEGLFMLEGIKLLKEAVCSGIELDSVFATSKNIPLCRELCPEDRIIEVSESVFEKLSTEKSPQGVICIAKYIDKIHIMNKIYNIEEFCRDGIRVMILSSIRDPGNLGTVIRTAAAFGVDELILSDDCADIYNPKTVRASMGTLFRQRISYVSDLARAVIILKESGYNVCAAVLDKDSVSLPDMRITKKTAFVIGNEGHGIAPDVIKNASCKVYIPMRDGVESLNAATAAAVFMWQSALAEKKDNSGR